MAKETGQEVAQESTNIVFEEMAKKLNNNLKGTDIKPTDAQKVLERLKQTAVESAQGFAVIAVPGIAMSGVKSVLPEKKIGERGTPPEFKSLETAIQNQGGVLLGVEGETAIVADETGNVIGLPAVSEAAETKLSGAIPVDDAAVGDAVDSLVQGEITDETIEAFIQSMAPKEEAAVAADTQALEDTAVARAAALYDEGKPDEALAPLIEIGITVWDEGATDYPTFRATMKERLGDLWERVKSVLSRVWEMVGKYAERVRNVKGPLGNDRGSFSVALKETKVPTPDHVFEMVGTEKGNVFADYSALQKKHPEQFPTTEDVKVHVEYVLDKPDGFIPATKEEYTLLYRKNGEDKATVVEFELRGGKYRVRSAFVMAKGQLEQKITKAQRGSSEPPAPARSPQGEISSGSPPVTSDTGRVEPSDKDITPASGNVKTEESAAADENLLKETRKAMAASGKAKGGVKARIRRATGQYTVSNLVREDVALREGLKKAAQAAQIAYRAGNAD